MLSLLARSFYSSPESLRLCRNSLGILISCKKINSQKLPVNKLVYYKEGGLQVESSRLKNLRLNITENLLLLKLFQLHWIILESLINISFPELS